jgi:hypothetical protein
MAFGIEFPVRPAMVQDDRWSVPIGARLWENAG